MAKNFFTENDDLQFHFRNIGLAEVTRLRENDYRTAGAPANYTEATSRWTEKLAKVGELSGGPITERSMEADRVGVTISENRVHIPAATAWNLADLKAAGVMAVTLPYQYGGLHFPTTIYSMMQEMVSRADASLHNLFGLQSIAETLNSFGSDEQKAAILPKFASGEYDGAMALTEPNAGSDLQSVQVSATLDEQGVWRLNGVKHFITNGMAKVLLVLARSEEGSKDGRGLSMFQAHPCPEITYARIEHKLGIHGSPTVELHFNNAPAELVGKRRFGLTRYVMSLMNGARLAISAQSVGLEEACRQAAWEYCNARTQFGRKLSDLPPVREMLTRIDALTAASRTLLYETSRWVDLRDAWQKYAEANPDNEEAPVKIKEAARIADVLTPMTKAFNTESANQCAYDCIQCHGGKGYMRERPVERYYRDARIMNIYEGTTQLQVVAATAGLLKHSLSPVLDGLDAFPFAEECRPLLAKISIVREKLAEAEAALDANKENLELLSRRIVRGQTIVLASLLLLRDATRDPSRLAIARRFLWEFLPEAEMHAAVVCDSAGAIVM